MSVSIVHDDLKFAVKWASGMENVGDNDMRKKEGTNPKTKHLLESRRPNQVNVQRRILRGPCSEDNPPWIATSHPELQHVWKVQNLSASLLHPA